MTLAMRGAACLWAQIFWCWASGSVGTRLCMPACVSVCPSLFLQLSARVPDWWRADVSRGGGKRNPQRGPPCAALDSAHPAAVHPLSGLLRASSVRAPGTERGFLLLTHSLHVESVCGEHPDRVRSPLCRGCCFRFPFARGQVHRPARKAPPLQECERACDSLGRWLSPQRSPADGAPYARGSREPSGRRGAEPAADSWMARRQTQHTDGSGYYFSLCPWCCPSSHVSPFGSGLCFCPSSASPSLSAPLTELSLLSYVSQPQQTDPRLAAPHEDVSWESLGLSSGGNGEGPPQHNG